jgi:hypothetical protein
MKVDNDILEGGRRTEHKRNQSNNQINVAENQKKKGRLERREPSAKKYCLPKRFPKN